MSSSHNPIYLNCVIYHLVVTSGQAYILRLVGNLFNSQYANQCRKYIVNT